MGRSDSLVAAEAEKAMVATVHPLATDAGLAALERGGNAVDAAVAAALTLGVVDGHNSGLGGGCFILIRAPDGSMLALDGRETAPARAHRDMFVTNGKPQPDLSQTGPLASGTPGALAAYAVAIQEQGRLTLAELLKPAADLAENGFQVDDVYAENIRSVASTLAKYPASRAIFLTPDGRPYREGEWLRQPELARTYRAIAEQGIAWFYEGEFATAVDRWMAENRGLLNRDDFRRYKARRRQPIVTRYRDYTIVGFPPPSSGGTHVAQILNILEHFDLEDLWHQDRAQFAHVTVEAMKLAFADRAHWLGDADYVSVPRGLTDAVYAEQLAQRIDVRQATPVSGYGTPPRAEQDFFERHTTHVAVADAEGWWVAITATINTTFGSKVVIPGTGVVMNNEMDDFSIQPGVPNAFGLVGAEANAIAPGKRPLSSMSPTIVLRHGEPILTLGAAGGPTIISQVVLTIVRHIDLGWPLARALAAPRFHHQWSPDRVLLESAFSADLASELERRGHTVTKQDQIGVSQAIGLRADGRGFVGVHDPRVPGKAAGR
jgi:gamma-glutamyltranspeptidase/glutathione hydrolase